VKKIGDLLGGGQGQMPKIVLQSRVTLPPFGPSLPAGFVNWKANI